MHPEAFEQLRTEVLEELVEMYRFGCTAEQMLDVLEVREENARLYRFYLEAVCGDRLDGSIYLSGWKRDDRKNRLEILVYLENHLQRIRNCKA